MLKVFLKALGKLATTKHVFMYSDFSEEPVVFFQRKIFANYTQNLSLIVCCVLYLSLPLGFCTRSNQTKDDVYP